MSGDLTDAERRLIEPGERADAYYIEDTEGDDHEDWVSSNWCYDCVVPFVRHHRKRRGMRGLVWSRWTGDDDGPNFCAGCGKHLTVNLTDGGADEEVEHFDTHGVSPSDGPCLLDLLDAYTRDDPRRAKVLAWLRSILPAEVPDVG